MYEKENAKKIDYKKILKIVVQKVTLQFFFEKMVKGSCLDERKKYREIFEALDDDGSGAIGIDELEEPFIALGLVSNREDIKELINTVDQDGNGEIEFDEFLMIMRTIKRNDTQNQSSIYDFFKDIISGDFSKMKDMDPSLSFKLNFSQYRRKKLLDAIMLEENNIKKIKAQNILNSFERQLNLKKKKQDQESLLELSNNIFRKKSNDRDKH